MKPLLCYVANVPGHDDIPDQAVLVRDDHDYGAAEVQGPQANCGGAHQEHYVLLQVFLDERHDLTDKPEQGHDERNGHRGDGGGVQSSRGDGGLPEPGVIAVIEKTDAQVKNIKKLRKYILF